jgi:hypothetical protein
VAKAETLTAAERAFLIFHLSPPPAREWRWVPVPAPTNLVLRAFKSGPNGDVTAEVGAESYGRLSAFFDENFQVDLEALASLEIEVANDVDL